VTICVAGTAAGPGEAERQHAGHRRQRRVGDVEHVQHRPEVLGLAVVRDQQRVPAEVDVLVLEVRERVEPGDRRRRRVGDVEDREPLGAGHVGVVPLEVDAERSELCRAGLLRRSREHVGSPGDGEIREPGRENDRFELCFQQSAGDSVLPEIDVALGRVGHGLLDEDVADLEAAARSQNAMHLVKDLELVRAEIERAIRDHDVGPTVLDR